MIRCIIIDDELPAIDVLKRYIERLPNFELIGFETNPVAGIELIQREQPDVVFLDIQMEELNGIEVAQLLGDSSKIVFCTAYSEFAVTSYEYDAVDYLMKPVEFGRFVKAARRVADSLQQQMTGGTELLPDDYIYIKAGKRGKMVRIDLADVEFVEALGNYVSFGIIAGEQMPAYLKLKDLETNLPSQLFMRVHRSFIVALSQIAGIDQGEIILKANERRIPIGANYKELFLERMKNKLMIR